MDPELLMEVMEAREAILDADGDTDALRELLREHSSRVKKCEEEARRRWTPSRWTASARKISSSR